MKNLLKHLSRTAFCVNQLFGLDCDYKAVLTPENALLWND